MKGITTLLFDVDGTLLESTEFIIQATEHALSVKGLSVPDRTTISKNVGASFPDYYFSLTGTHEHTNELIEIHRTFQYSNYHLAKPFPNTVSTLKYLKNKGYKMATITTRSKKTSHQTLINAGIFDLFDVIISGEDAAALKPDPAPLFKALEHIKEKPEHAVMIGDSYQDIQAGKNAGTKTIRATYGFHQDNIHEPEPDLFLEDIKDLQRYF